MSNKVHTVAYFVSHPIQYQAPLLKLLSSQPDIDLTVFFLTDLSIDTYHDIGFNKPIHWDTPLLDGYKYSFLKSSLKNSKFSIGNPKVSIIDVNKTLTLKKWDAIWMHGYNNLALLFIIWRAKQLKIPILFRGESNLISTSQGPLKDLFIRWLVKRSTVLLWISTDNRDYYLHYGAKKNQLFFMPYAVNNDFFQTIKETKSTKKLSLRKCIILFASKFITRKNAPLLLEAFQQLDQSTQDRAELWFVGDGEDKALLDEHIKKFELTDRVLLLGFKNQSEMPSVLAQCDVFVLPSKKEPFGLIINEAMNLGKAIITTNEVGAARDLVTHKDNGWVIPANDLTALKSALSEAVNNPQGLIEMGERSLSKINNWSYTQNIEGIRSALNKLPDRDK